jgi:hypothetical protein
MLYALLLPLSCMKKFLQKYQLAMYATIGSFFGLAFASVVMAQVIGAHGIINEFDANQADDLVCTTSITYEDIPDITTTFTLNGNGDEVVALFQGDWEVGGSPLIRFVVDGVPQMGEVELHDGGEDITAGFNFVSNTLSAGTHTASIQWFTAADSTTCMTNRSLVVLHK